MKVELVTEHGLLKAESKLAGLTTGKLKVNINTNSNGDEVLSVFVKKPQPANQGGHVTRWVEVFSWPDSDVVQIRGV